MTARVIGLCLSSWFGGFASAQTGDPVLEGPVWAVEGDEDGYLGFSVASAGDVDGDGYSDVIVGVLDAPFGSALIYRGSAQGLSLGSTWTLLGDGPRQLGHSVASAGDVNGDGYGDVVVGDGHLFGDSVTVWLYEGSALGLATEPSWTSSEGDAGDDYGYSAAGAGDVNGDGYSDVIVGEPRADKVYVFHGSASGLSTTAAWIESGEAGSFGWSVASAGDVNRDGFDDVIIGAPSLDNGSNNEGRAYVYLGSASGLATEPAWTDESDQHFASFGWSVASAGDVNGDGYGDVIGGAPYFDLGEPNEGIAVLYLGSASGLSTSFDWVADPDLAQTHYGTSVASAGDVNGDGFGDVIVGAPQYGGSGDDPNGGRAFLYLGSPSGLGTSAEWIGEGFNFGEFGSFFGDSVASAGDIDGDGYSDVIVGAREFDNGESNVGAAFLYRGSAAALATEAAWTTDFGHEFDRVGSSIASAGDVNADGYADVLVGNPNMDWGQFPAVGGAFLYLGSSSGPEEVATWSIVGDQVGSGLGSALSAGDVDGDGFDDAIIGAWLFDNGESDEGAAFVYAGTSTGLASTPSWTVEGNQANAFLGYSLACAGDVNGDGFLDVIAGAWGYDNGHSREGLALVWHGTPTGLSTTPSWSLEGEATNVALGAKVAGAGDVDGDGFSDVVLSRASEFHLHRGSSQGLASTSSWSASGAGRVASGGDVNGDGFSDLVTGNPGEFTDDGFAQLYLGSANGPSTTPDWIEYGGIWFGRFGNSVSTAGDVDGDGYSDVIIGAPGNPEQFAAELAHVYLGSASGLASSPVWTESDPDVTEFGTAVAGAGDVDGDGYGDVMIGAPLWDGRGQALVYLGNEGRGGWTRSPQQMTSDGARPIALHGRSDERRSFDVRLRFEQTLATFQWASPAAPTARLEWEVAPLGVALDGSAIESGSPQPITGAPLVFDELARLGPSATNKPFHWRARIRTNNPLFPVTPWTWLHGNGVSEAKLRRGVIADPTPGTPVPVPATPHPKRP